MMKYRLSLFVIIAIALGISGCSVRDMAASGMV